MAERRSLVRAFGAPLGVGLVAAVGVAYYALIWVPDQQQYFTNRNLRLLTSLGASVQASIDNLDSVLDHASTAATDSSQLSAYFNSQVPGLIVETEVSEHPLERKGKGNFASDPPTLDIQSDEGTFFLVLGYRPKSTHRPPTFVKARVDSFVQPGQILRDFDALVVARAATGQVIYQHPRMLAETQLTHLNSLTSADGKPIDPRALGRVSVVAEINLAGASFKLFSEPLQLSYPAVGESEGAPTAPEAWIVCGLTRSARFNAESRAMPLTYILWFTLAIVLLLVSAPIIRLFTIGPTTRLRARDPVFLTLTMFGSTGLITLGLLQGYRTAASTLSGSLATRLERFAGDIADNFKAEQKAVWDELDALERSPEFAEVKAHLAAQDSESNGLPRLSFEAPAKARNARGAGSSRCAPKWACRTNILHEDKKKLPLDNYPYFQFVTWSDDQGLQRLKWTTRKNVTPFLNFETTEVPYYRKAKTASMWGLETRGVSTFRSPNTGETLTIFWRQRPGTKKQGPGTKNQAPEMTLAAVATKPLSLVGPLIAGDLQYAVIDREGVVQFHTDATKNLSENFLRECDEDAELGALVRTAGTGSLVTRYSGRRHQLYVRPLETGAPDRAYGPNEWSLVVFQSLESRETMTTEMVSTASILFLLYAGIIGTLWAMLAVLWRRYPSRWLWPLESESTAYRSIVAVNAILLLAFMVLIQIAGSGALLIGAAAIGLLAPAFALARIDHNPVYRRNVTPRIPNPKSRIPSVLSHLDWRTAHLLAVTSLLVVSAVLPAIAFFRVAHDLETELMIRREQITLVRRVGDWKADVTEKYRDVRGHCAIAASLALACDRSKDEFRPYWDYSAHSSFGRLVLSEKSLAPPNPNPRLSSLVAGALGWIRPSYNMIARETGSLMSGNAWDDFKTVSSWTGGQEASLDKSGVSVRTKWNRWTLPPHPMWWAGLIAWCAVLFAGVRAMSRRLFLLDNGPVRCNCATAGPDPTFGHAVSTLRRKVGREDVIELFEEECSVLPQLRAIGADIAGDLPDAVDLTPERLLEEISTRAEACYRALWSACSCAEKLALVQLADEGVVNPGTRPVLHHLMSRGLVVKDPFPRLMTRGFRAFVRTALPVATIGKWEQADQAIPWQTIISTTVVAGMVFLFVAQRDVASAWIAYLTGASAALPALFKLMGGLRLRSDAPTT
jgi:hypothetical protein